MRSFLLVILSISVNAFAKPIPPCDIVKTKASLLSSESRIYGNAFAIDKEHLISNDHSFFSDNQNIMVMFADGSMIEAKIARRDFHTDTAVLKLVSGRALNACSLAVNSNPKGSAEVFNFRAETAVLEKSTAQVISNKSTNLIVPGVTSSIELNLKGYESMSGAPAFIDDQVIGMITQATDKNTVLLIPSSQLVDAKKPTDRRYDFIPQQNKFSFKGGFDLLFGDKAAGGGIHEGSVGGGGIHEGQKSPLRNMYRLESGNRPISAQKNKELVIVDVTNLEALSESQPKLAELLTTTKARRIAILSVDGKPVDNNLALIRILEECTVCKIDRFLIIDARASEMTDEYLKLALLINRLGASLSQYTPNKVVTKTQMITSALTGTLTQIADLAASGVSDPHLIEQFNENWSKIGQAMLSTVITDELSDLYLEIETLIAKLNLVKPRRIF